MPEPTLREFVEQSRLAHQREHDQHEKEHERDHEATEKAIQTATLSLDKRLDSMNEFRQALTEQQATFVRREMLDAAVEQINDLRRTYANVQGRMIGIGAAFAVVATLVSIAIRLL